MDSFTEADFKKIIARRDRRFDGRFFFGVRTTKIYCRPVCPAKPKPENIIIFKSTSEAERNGYRPCMRCRPDLAPGSKLLDGTLNTVSRALRIMNDCPDEELNVEALADLLGVSGRHLRRLFDEHLGASPIEILITQRLHLAKQIVQSTRTPVTDIAFAAGFQSVRRFNEAFKSRYRKSPSELRKSKQRDRSNTLHISLPVRLPYDWKHVLSYLKRHEAYGIERVENDRYLRFIPLGESFGTVIVSGPAKQEALDVELVNIPLREIRNLLPRLRRLFDTEHNPVHLPRTKALSPNGVRVPGAFDPFETSVSIILSQLVSTEHAKQKLRTLVERYGRPIKSETEVVFEFPSPAVLAAAKIEEIGIPRARAGAIRELARLVDTGKIDFRPAANFDTALETFVAIKGIGPWTAAMIGMRCLGDPDAFPKLDLIVQRALEKNLVDEADWRSSRAYLTHCLWRDFGGELSRKKHGAKNERSNSKLSKPNRHAVSRGGE